MKNFLKLLTLLLVIILPIVSCSEEDEGAKQAQTDKDTLIIPGEGSQPSVQHNQLALYVTANEVPVGTVVTFTTILNGVNVTNQVTYYVNNLQIQGSSISSTQTGTFQVQAKLNGYIDSNIQTIVYGAGNNPNPTGNFILNNQGYNVNIAAIVYNDIVAIDEAQTQFATYWIAVVANNPQLAQANVRAYVHFLTPVTGQGQNMEPTLPTANNATYFTTTQVTAGGLVINDAQGTGQVSFTTLNIDPQTLVGDANFNSTSTDPAVNLNLRINYAGPIQLIDNTEQPRLQTNQKAKSINKIDLKEVTSQLENKLK